MLRLGTAIIFVATMTLPTSVVAQAPTAASTIEVKAKKVCKTEPVIGSRVGGKRVCRTPAEWAAIQLQDRQTVEGYQHQACRNGATSTGGAIQC